MKKTALFIFILLLGSVLWAQNRYALVIGNANYPRVDDRLPNAINDTNDISAALRGLGYQVELRQNLQCVEMIRVIDAFIARLRGDRNSEGFFWYAGHAMEIDGENLLLPLDVNVESNNMIKRTAYSVNDLTRDLNRVRNKLNVVVLDACRVPPAVGGGSRSMGDTSRVLKTVTLTEAEADLLIIYSTASGTTASDGTGSRNSPFTQAFLNNINSTEPLTLMVSHVSRETMNLTGQLQRPYTSGSIVSDTYYSLNPAGGRPSPTPAPQSSPSSSPTPTPNTTTVPANFVRINGGTFTMGSPSNEPNRENDETQHQVTVSSFYMSRYEVTQREYQEVMGTNPSYFRGDNLPVECVRWYDAVEFCNRRSEREGLTPAYTIDKSRSDPNNRSEFIYDTVRWLITWNRNANGYRLPTEAEWEYACRAGTQTPYNTGISIRDNTGWYPANSNDTSHPVGQKPANAWGLHDMHGNVLEWCWDWYGNYSSGAQTDPQGAVSGSDRVLRGGSFRNDWQYLRSAARLHYTPFFPDYFVGFRLVRNAQ